MPKVSIRWQNRPDWEVGDPSGRSDPGGTIAPGRQPDEGDPEPPRADAAVGGLVSLALRAGNARLALRTFASNLLHATDGRDVLLNSPDGWEVEQPWLWWLGPTGSSSSGGGPFGNPIPGAGYGPAMAAAGMPAVSRATGLIVDTIGTLPWHVYRNETEKLATPPWIADPQALRLDGRVVDTMRLDETRMSAVDFWCQWILSALWWGDGFIYVPARDEQGAPKPPLWVLHPDDVQLKDGRYLVANVELAAGKIIHLRGQTPIIDGRGSGVLSRFAGELATATALRAYVAGAFTAGVPAGYLKTSQPNVTQEQADNLKTRWMAQHGGRRSIAVLNSTTEFHPLTWSPVDADAADFSRLTLSQIALMFGLPPGMLGGPTGDTLTYSTNEMRMLELYQLTLLPWIGRIEAVLNAQLPGGTKPRIEVDGLLRADIKTRMEAYQIGISTGVLTRDEARALENRPPLAQAGAVL
jgi:HK97 family phage portal protein